MSRAQLRAHGRAARAGEAKIHLHHARSLIARDTDTHQGIPITSVPRTLLDLAATVRPDRLERALAQAEHLQLYDHRAITELLARSNGHRGTRALIEATALDPKLTRSEWEGRLLKRAAFEADRRRDAALQADGYRVVRFTWRTPDDVILRRLRALLSPARTLPRSG